MHPGDKGGGIKLDALDRLRQRGTRFITPAVVCQQHAQLVEQAAQQGAHLIVRDRRGRPVLLLTPTHLLEFAEHRRTLTFEILNTPQHRCRVGDLAGQTDGSTDLAGQTLRAALEAEHLAAIDMFAAGDLGHGSVQALHALVGLKIDLQPIEHCALDVCRGDAPAALAVAVEAAADGGSR